MLYPTLKDTILRLQNIAKNPNTKKEEAKLSLKISNDLTKYLDHNSKKGSRKKAS